MSTVNSVAAQGLRDSDRFYMAFWKKTALKTAAAREALDRIDALDDRNASHAAALARAAADAVAANPHARLAALRAGLQLVEAGAASGISGMAGMAVSVQSKLGASGCSAAMFGAVLQTATAESAPEAPFAQMLGRLQQPAAALQVLSAGVPSTTAGFAAAAERVGGARLGAVISDLRAEAQASRDTAALEVLDRLDALRQLPVSDALKSTLAAAAVATIQAGSPGGPLLTAKLATTALRLVSVSESDRKALAAAALADAAKGRYPADSPVPAWLAFSEKVGDAGIGAAVLGAVVDGQPASVQKTAAILDGRRAKLDPAQAGALFDLLQAADRDGKHAETFSTYRYLEQRLGVSDALKVAVLADGIHQLAAGHAAAPPDPAGVALRVGSRADAATARALGDAVLAQKASQADPAAAGMLSALRRSLALPQGEEKYVAATFQQIMRELQKPPTDVAGWAAAASRVIPASGYYLDRLHAARELLPALAGAGPDATQQAKCHLLASMAAHDAYDVSSQTNAILAGLKALSNPPKTAGNPLAAFGSTLCGSLQYHVDRVQLASDVAAALKAQAAAAGDAVLSDEADLLQRMVAIPSPEEQYHAAPLITGLEALGAGRKYPGDAFAGFASQLVAAAHYYVQQSAVADAAAQVMQVRALQSNAPDRAAQSGFVHEVAGMQFADANSRAAALAAGLTAAAVGKGAQEDGLASVALAMVRAAKTPPDQIHVAERALAEIHQMAEKSGEPERLDLIETYEQAANLQNYEAKYQAQVAALALDGIARRPEVEPGELASTGLKMIQAASYVVSALQVGEAILNGLDALAADEKDTIYVPALVADIRQKMAAAGGDERAQDKALTSGLQEIARLKGDAFRKALVAAAQQQHPEDQPRIEDGGRYVVIGGVRVPKTK